MRLFSEQRELIQYARKFISERIGSLEKDCRHCLFQSSPDAPAPFPALLYCFATIDLLGALYSGNAAKNAPTSEQSKEYMRKFMSYTTEQTELLREVFRHKLVHLAQPNPITIDDSRRISWVYHHKNREKHLIIEPLREKQKIAVTTIHSIECNYVFHLGIWNIVEDIISSVEKPNGYLESLEKSRDLQDKFELAISQIYGLEIGVKDK